MAQGLIIREPQPCTVGILRRQLPSQGVEFGLCMNDVRMWGLCFGCQGVKLGLRKNDIHI